MAQVWTCSGLEVKTLEEDLPIVRLDTVSAGREGLGSKKVYETKKDEVGAKGVLYKWTNASRWLNTNLRFNIGWAKREGLGTKKKYATKKDKVGEQRGLSKWTTNGSRRLNEYQILSFQMSVDAENCTSYVTEAKGSYIMDLNIDWMSSQATVSDDEHNLKEEIAYYIENLLKPFGTIPVPKQAEKRKTNRHDVYLQVQNKTIQMIYGFDNSSEDKRTMKTFCSGQISNSSHNSEKMSSPDLTETDQKELPKPSIDDSQVSNRFHSNTDQNLMSDPCENYKYESKMEIFCGEGTHEGQSSSPSGINMVNIYNLATSAGSQFTKPTDVGTTAEIKLTRPTAVDTTAEVQLKQPTPVDIISEGQLKQPTPVDIIAEGQLKQPTHLDIIAEGQLKQPTPVDIIAEVQLEQPTHVDIIAEGHLKQPTPVDIVAEGQLKQHTPVDIISEGQLKQPTPVNIISEGQLKQHIPVDTVAEGQLKQPTPVGIIAEGQFTMPTPVVTIAEGQLKQPAHVDIIAEGQLKQPTHVDIIAEGQLKQPTHVDIIAEGQLKQHTPVGIIAGGLFTKLTDVVSNAGSQLISLKLSGWLFVVIVLCQIGHTSNKLLSNDMSVNCALDSMVTINMSIAPHTDYSIIMQNTEIGACDGQSCYIMQDFFELYNIMQSVDMSWNLTIRRVTCNDSGIAVKKTGGQIVQFIKINVHGCEDTHDHVNTTTGSQSKGEAITKHGYGKIIGVVIAAFILIALFLLYAYCIVTNSTQSNTSFELFLEHGNHYYP